MKKEPIKKSLKDLNLLDRFLFAEAMEDPVILTNILEIILGEEVVLKCLPQTEKEARRSPLKRFVKLDVWAMDINDTIYDTEVQNKDTKNIPKRSRLYQSLIDSQLLPPGEIDFNALNNTFIIIIAPFDLFGKGAYKYTFRMSCEEFREVCLADGAVRIFLNTHGTNGEDVSPELVELLRYMEHTNADTSGHCESKRIQNMQERIAEIKSSEEIGVRYMQQWEEVLLERQEARAEGRAEGRNQKLKELIQKKLAKGKGIDLIAEELEEEPKVIRELVEHFDSPETKD